MRTRVGVVWSCTVILFAPVSAGKPPVETVVAPPASLAALRAEAVEEVSSGRLPSLVIGVLRGGEVLWQEAIGWADVEHEVGATSRTPYGLASLGKSITASAVMRLVDRGLVDLDRPVNSLLGDASLRSPAGYADAVTTRHLLQMTASVPHGNYTYFDRQHADALTPERLTRYRGLVPFPAGEVFTYSNFSYAVLEQLIEAVSGQIYDAFLREELFEPLGMRDAFVAESTTPSKGTARYDDDGELLRTAYPHPRSSRAMNASLADLLQYARAHLGHRPLLKPATLRQMHTRRGEARNALFAMGWGSFDLGEDRLWLLSNGRSGGAQSTLTLFPNDDLAVVVLTNRTGDVTDGLAFRIADALLPGFLDRFDRLRTEYEAWAMREYSPEPDLLGSWTGTVETADGPVELGLDFQPDGDVHVNLGDYPTLLSDVAWREGLLAGGFLGELPLEESAGHAHPIELTLRPSQERLEGYATAIFENDRGRFALAAAVQLSRLPASGTPAPARD